MGKTSKIIVFCVVSLIIIIIFTYIKETRGGAVMWIGGIAIMWMYRSMFGKKDDDIKLKK